MSITNDLSSGSPCANFMTNIKQAVNVLGTEYAVKIKKYDEDETFARDGSDGYCDPYIKEIVICDMSTYLGFEKEPETSLCILQKETLRHEIVHAFFYESGLHDSSVNYDGPYTKNEELVDWITLQGIKIYKAWEETGAI